MKKKRTWRNVIKGIGNTIDEMKPVAKPPEEKKADLTKEVLTVSEFQHDKRNQLCDWVNEYDIDVKAITHDGNKYFVFHWKTIEINKQS